MRVWGSASEDGFSLVGAFLAVGILSFGTAIAYKMLAMQMRTRSSLDGRTEFTRLKELIGSNIDCRKTFEEAGFSPDDLTNCSSTTAAQTGPYLPLYRRTTGFGSLELTHNKTVNDSGRLADFLFRVSCSATERTLIVRVARQHNGQYLKDPMTGRLQDFESSKSLMFGYHESVLPLCYDLPQAPEKTYNAMYFKHFVRGAAAEDGGGDFDTVVGNSVLETDAVTPLPGCNGFYCTKSNVDGGFSTLSLAPDKPIPIIRPAGDVDVVLSFLGATDWNGINNWGRSEADHRQTFLRVLYKINGASDVVNYALLTAAPNGDTGGPLIVSKVISLDAGQSLEIYRVETWIKQLAPDYLHPRTPALFQSNNLFLGIPQQHGVMTFTVRGKLSVTLTEPRP